MATTKTVNVTTGKFLNYQITKAGYKPITGSVFVDSNKTVNVNMISTESEEEVYKLGDRILNMASFVCYYKPGGIYDNKPISTTVIEQTQGSGLSNLGVKKGIFEAQVNPSYDKTAKEENYEFTYDGNNWNYDSNIVNLDDYGIFFNTTTSILNSGDKINVKYDVYSKYAVFVLDANYRTNKGMCTSDTDWVGYPNYSSVNAGTGTASNVWYYNQDGQESATWSNEKLLDNDGYSWSTLPAMNYCRGLGQFILANGIKLYPLVPNLTEIISIWKNKVFLDSIDPWIQAGNTSYNLSTWNFTSNRVNSCCEISASGLYSVASDGSIGYGSQSGWSDHTKQYSFGIIPIFELPVK